MYSQSVGRREETAAESKTKPMTVIAEVRPLQAEVGGGGGGELTYISSRTAKEKKKKSEKVGYVVTFRRRSIAKQLAAESKTKTYDGDS